MVAIGLASSANAGVTQIGDFRIASTGHPSPGTVFDPGFTQATRGVLTAPAGSEIISTLSVGSQNASGLAEQEFDPRIKTFTAASQILNLSRFGPSTNGGVSGATRAGMAQWSFDLTPLDTYLSTNGLTLTELDLDMVFDLKDETNILDYYLSYTNATESISKADIDVTTIGDAVGVGGAGSNNWTNFFNPARGSSIGDVINGTHRVLLVDHVGDVNSSESLLSLFNAGVRQFNLQVAAGNFQSNDQFKMIAGSGLSITTIPEPASLALLGAGLAMACSRRSK